MSKEKVMTADPGMMTEPTRTVDAAGTQEWYVNGQLHRPDGPAVISAAGSQEWWVRGQNITTQVNSWMQTQAVTWPWDDQTQMQFLLTWG
jgi:ribosomal protein S12 methylthiotransferase accessory factor YcaO